MIYKDEEVKTLLQKLYNYKCAYCETHTKGGTIDHYRPKSIYWWLSYSWDNLLFVCSDCNSKKKNNFEIIENKRIETPDSNYKENLHSLAKEYNQKENPKCIHPEIDDITDLLIFKKDGTIESDNERCTYRHVSFIRLHFFAKLCVFTFARLCVKYLIINFSQSFAKFFAKFRKEKSVNYF